MVASAELLSPGEFVVPLSSRSSDSPKSLFGASCRSRREMLLIVALLLICCGPCAMFACLANTGGVFIVANVSIVARHCPCALIAKTHIHLKLLQGLVAVRSSCQVYEHRVQGDCLRDEHAFSASKIALIDTFRESTGTASETLAQKIERKRHRELEAASGGIELQRVRPVLFGIAADDWLKVKEPTLADKTRAMYAADVGHLKPHFAKLLLTDIAARDVSDYVKARRRDGVADKSIRNELGTLRAILKKHRRWEVIKDDVTLPRGREDIGQALHVEEEERLLKACARSHSRSLLVAVTLALNTGMRHDEIRLLRWRQVDLTNQAITVGKAKTDHGTGRALPLNQRALRALEEWSRQFPDRNSQHFVFPSEKVGHSFEAGMMTCYDTDPTKPILSWKTAWTTARTAAVVSCRFHDLRHTTVTRLLERGASFATVATVMGWSPGTATKMAKRYGHIGRTAQRDALALLDAEAPRRPNAPREIVSPHPTIQ